MSEFQPNPLPPTGGLRTTLYDLLRRGENLLFRMAVPKERREAASQAAETFTGEFMDYLKEGTSTKLSPLHPTAAQLEYMRFMLESADNGSLALQSTTGDLGGYIQQRIKQFYIGGVQGYKHIIEKVYLASRNADPLDESLLRWFANAPNAEQIRYLTDFRAASVGTTYVVDDDFPDQMSVTGAISTLDETGQPIAHQPGSIFFMFFPSKPLTSEEVIKLRMIPASYQGWKNSVGVFGNGQRIDFTTERTEGEGKNIVSFQYHLLGSFGGEKSGKAYWVYGSNENLNKQTVIETATAKQPVIRPATNS